MKLKARLAKLMKTIDALTLRERLFVFAAMLIVAGGAWEAFLASPLETRESIATRKIETTRERLEQLDQSVALAAQGIGAGMSNQFDTLRALRRQVEEGEESVRIFTSDLVDTSQMRFVLEELIRRQRGLELVRASNLAVRPLIDPDTSAAQAAGDDRPMLYRHGLLLELEGSYLDCLAYMEEVERLPWHIFWGSLELESEEPPRNRIRLELYTLSLEEAWIGV